jgi:hypothetical protein
MGSCPSCGLHVCHHRHHRHHRHRRNRLVVDLINPASAWGVRMGQYCWLWLLKERSGCGLDAGTPRDLKSSSAALQGLQ